MQANVPFWMRQRQIKVEPVNDTTVTLKAPNLPAYELALRPGGEGVGYGVALYHLPGSGEKTLVAEAPTGLDQQPAAWQFGFELFRQRVII